MVGARARARIMAWALTMVKARAMGRTLASNNADDVITMMSC